MNGLQSHPAVCTDMSALLWHDSCKFALTLNQAVYVAHFVSEDRARAAMADG